MSSANISELGYIIRSEAPPPVYGVAALTSAGIQAQIDALDAKVGGTIQLEAATYTLTAPVIINKPNCSIKGVDEKATRINFSYDGIAFDVQAVDAEISDLMVTGPAHSLFPLSTAFKISSGARVHIEDCTITGCKRAIYNVGFDPHTHITGVTYKQIGTATCGSFLVSDRNDVLATEAGIHVSNCDIANCADNAIRIIQSSRTHIQECTIASQGVSTSHIFFGSTTGFMDQLLIKDCEFSATALINNAINGDVGGTQTVDDIQILGCVSNVTTPPNAFNLDFEDKVVKLFVSDCSFNGTTSYSINISNVGSPVVSGCSNSGTGISNGLVLLTSCQNAQIIGCRAQNVGERVIEIVDSNDVIVSGCLLNRGFGFVSMVLNITGTSARCAITGNNIQSTAGSSPPIVAAGVGSHTITGNTILVLGTANGIFVNSPNCVVSGNKITTVGGFCITTVAAQTAITGNHCNGTAIVLSIGAASTNCTICSNVLNTTAANAATIAFGGTATSFGNSIKGAWQGTGIAAIVGGPNALATADLVF